MYCGSCLDMALFSIELVLDTTIPSGQMLNLSEQLLFFIYNMVVFLDTALGFSVVAVVVTLTVGSWCQCHSAYSCALNIHRKDTIDITPPEHVRRCLQRGVGKIEVK